MTIPVVLFALAAVGGIILAAQRFRGQGQPSLPLALVHGAAAACGLVGLLLAVVRGAPGLATAALGLFLVAALGGFVLFAMHLQKRALPIPLVLIHGLAAVVAFGTLLVAVFG